MLMYGPSPSTVSGPAPPTTYEGVGARIPSAWWVLRRKPLLDPPGEGDGQAPPVQDAGRSSRFLGGQSSSPPLSRICRATAHSLMLSTLAAKAILETAKGMVVRHASVSIEEAARHLRVYTERHRSRLTDTARAPTHGTLDLTAVSTPSGQELSPHLLDYATTKGANRDLRPGPRGEPGGARHPCERRGPWPRVDTSDPRHLARHLDVRRAKPSSAPGPARRDGARVCLPCLTAGQLCHRRGSQRHWRYTPGLASSALARSFLRSAFTGRTDATAPRARRRGPTCPAAAPGSGGGAGARRGSTR
ncbi:ANTAR domain-containing protein [Streptomyces melanosporofaciens]|uniref:ANTAR domain-containing protein n=1 Tax=Streptomyces melanosporofaciens TaxID=67327 RepID=A0A1H4MQ26_STRMJ|nr:ANTAR domain-containing protein [Streptomyces melanosporofaciens]